MLTIRCLLLQTLGVWLLVPPIHSLPAAAHSGAVHSPLPAGVYFGAGVGMGEKRCPATEELLRPCGAVLHRSQLLVLEQHSSGASPPLHPITPLQPIAGSIVGGLVYHRHGAQAVYIVACGVLAAGWLLTSLAQLAVALSGRHQSSRDKYLQVAAVELADVEHNQP